MHLRPGSWSVNEQSLDYLSSPYRVYRAGRPHRVTINRAAWGPDGQLPYTFGAHRLYVNTMQMITDPMLDEGAAFTRTGYRLTHRGQTVVSTSVRSNASRAILKALPGPGWYTLTASARRPAGQLFPGALSRRVEVKLHFYDDLVNYQQMRGYTTRFLPAGLDMRDRAAPGAHTRVMLRLQRDAPGDPSVVQLPDAVASVSAAWSANAGRSWHSAPVVRRNGHWTLVVPNPPSGAVSLRATVVDSHGNSTRTTVIAGYAVG